MLDLASWDWNAITVGDAYRAPSLELCACTLGLVYALHFITYYGSFAFPAFRRLSGNDKLVWCTDIIFALVTFVLMAVYPLALLPLNEEHELRWRGNHPLGVIGLLLHTCYCLYETSIYLKIGKSAEFYAHHVVVVLNYTACLYSGHVQYYAIFCGLVEFTNPFLSVFDMCKLVGSKGAVFKASGILLWLSFIFFRVLLLPVWLYMHINDIMDSAHTWGESNVVLKYSCIPSVVFLWLLSSFWWYKMTRAMIKMAGGSKSSKQKFEKKAE